jgi:hypothetical protein
MIILPMIKPLLAHTDHHLHHSKDAKNKQKAQIKNHHDQMNHNQINHKQQQNKRVKTIVTQPVLIKNYTILQSNLIASLTLGEYIFFAMINTPFILYLIKRKILR